MFIVRINTQLRTRLRHQSNNRQNFLHPSKKEKHIGVWFAPPTGIITLDRLTVEIFSSGRYLKKNCFCLVEDIPGVLEGLQPQNLTCDNCCEYPSK